MNGFVARRTPALSVLVALAIGLAACSNGTTDEGLSSPSPNEPSADDASSTSAFVETAVWDTDSVGVSFAAPNGLTVDDDGNVFSTEFQGGHLRKFTPEGAVVFEVAGNGTEPGMLSNPIGVAVAGDGAIYVSESGSHRVSRFGPDGSFESSWGGQGADAGRFQSAMGIAVSADGEVFVADFGNHRVQVFDPTGTYVREWGQEGIATGDFDNPIGLQIGPDGNVWVVDSGNERVQVFTQDGTHVRSFDDVGPGPQIISLNDLGEFYVSSPFADSTVRHFDPTGELLGFVGDGLSGPHGTATGRADVLYVADTANGVIRTFTRDT